MLIVNADDFGANVNSTDRTLEAFAAGALSSATAMVWMRGSERAARLARERGLPLGLHLNLTLPFDGADVPHAARDRQLRLTEFFRPDSWRTNLDVRPEEPLVRDAIADQLDRFGEQYGEPTHLDGHHFVHVHDAVLDVLPRGLLIRPMLRDPSAADAPPSPRERALHARFRAPSLTVAFERLHPELGGNGFAILERAREHSLEVMCHPHDAGHIQALLSPEWLRALGALPVGSYRDLRARD